MSDCNIRVIVRFRPVNDRERAEGGGIATQLTFPDDQSVEVTPWNNRGQQSFAFDKVFWDPRTSQEDVYNLAAKKSIDDVLNGYNSTIFAYGQTGAGKSFTMFGADITVTHLKGIIPRACMHIFAHIARDTEGTEYTIKCSFLEIYKEVIRDLLNPQNNQANKGGLKIRETPSRGVWVEGLHEEYVTCEQDVLDLIKEGEKFRATSSTDMNATSSRSHSLFILTIHQKSKDGSTKEGKLNLADLAGSEKVGKTGATGQTLEEAKKINQSLSALGNCINALTKSKKTHIPYRDSRLTHVLRESLGGNCKTTLLVACSPHIFNLEETISTLQFAKRAKTIKNTVHVNKQRSVAELMAIIEQLKKELSFLKRYSKALEEQLEKLVGPNWKTDLNITALPEDIASSSSTTESSSSSSSSSGSSSSSSSSSSSAQEEADVDDENDGYGSSSSSSASSSPRSSNAGVPVASGDGKARPSYFEGDASLALAELNVELQRTKESTQLRIEQLEDDIEGLREEKKDLIETQNRLREEIDNLKDSYENKLEQMDKVQQQILDEKRKVEYESQQLLLNKDAQEQSILSANERSNELRNKLQQFQSEMDEVIRAKEQVSSEKQQLDRVREELQEQLEKKADQLSETQQRIAELSEELKKARNLSLEATLQKNTTALELKSLNDQLAASRNSSKELEAKLRAVQQEKDSIASEFQIAVERIRQLEDDVRDLRSELEKSQLIEMQMRQAGEVSMAQVLQDHVPVSQVEREKKENEKLRTINEQYMQQLRSEREHVIQLQHQLGNLKEEQQEHIISSSRLHETELNSAQLRISLLESQLEEEESGNKRKILMLEDRLNERSNQLQAEREHRRQVEALLEARNHEILEKDRKLRQYSVDLEDRDHELARLKGHSENQAKTIIHQTSRLDELDGDLRRIREDFERVQTELDQAAEINLNNAQQFEKQLELQQQELEKVGNSRIRVPVHPKKEKTFFESLFGKTVLPTLSQLKNPDKIGYLLKRGDWFKWWEARLFVLSGSSIYYFENDQNQSVKANGEIELDECKIAVATKATGKKFSFGVFHPTRKNWFLAAATEQEAREWIKALRLRVAELTGVLPADSTPRRSASMAVTGSSPSVVISEGEDPAFLTPKKGQTQTQQPPRRRNDGPLS